MVLLVFPRFQLGNYSSFIVLKIKKKLKLLLTPGTTVNSTKGIPCERISANRKEKQTNKQTNARKRKKDKVGKNEVGRSVQLTVKDNAL